MLFPIVVCVREINNRNFDIFLSFLCPNKKNWLTFCFFLVNVSLNLSNLIFSAIECGKVEKGHHQMSQQQKQNGYKIHIFSTQGKRKNRHFLWFGGNSSSRKKYKDECVFRSKYVMFINRGTELPNYQQQQ